MMTPASAASLKKRVQDFSSSTYSNIPPNLAVPPTHSVEPALYDVRGETPQGWEPYFLSVNNYVAVSESGNLREPRLPLSANYGCEMWI